MKFENNRDPEKFKIHSTSTVLRKIINFVYSLILTIAIDPLDRPSVTASRDHYFTNVPPSILSYYQTSSERNIFSNGNNVYY